MNLIRRVTRILDPIRWAVMLLVIPAHALIAVQAWRGDKIAIGFLAALLYFWTFMAIANGQAWGGTLQRWRKTIDGWQESNKMIVDYSHLIAEAADNLATWDREKAEDIITRANAISALRAANMREKMND